MRKNYLTGASLAFFTLWNVNNVGAQLVNCNAFMQGNHLEVGVGPNGAFGTSETQPSGYHGNVADSMYNSCTTSLTTNTELGFVADPNYTGWAHSIGDFIMPGRIPREGWAMEDSSGMATAYSSYFTYLGSGFTGTLNGSNLSVTTTGGTLQSEWLGYFGADSITVDQITVIDTGNLYLNMQVSFANTHSSVTDTFYYMRTVNPHNEYMLTSNLGTNLKVEYQLPNAYNLTVVSASGISDSNNYMALGCGDSRARGFLIQDTTMPYAGSLASIYKGDSVHYQYSGTMSGNYAMGLVFQIILGAGASTSINFGYSFRGGVVDSVYGDTITTALNTRNISQGSIAIYPNPANDAVHVTGVAAGQTVEVADILGRTLLTQAVAQNFCTLSIGALPSGTYLVSVRAANGELIAVSRVAKN